MMNIIIVGCDRVGTSLAEQLYADGNNVTVVDLDADKVKEISGKLDIMGVVGNGATHTTQLEAGIKKADLLIAVTGSDELNLLCCLIFFVASAIPSHADDYTAFDSIFGGTWFILLGSTVAFLISACINNFLNWSIGKAFSKNPESKLAYATSTYVSTCIGQFMDNLIFSVIVFVFFAIYQN